MDRLNDLLPEVPLNAVVRERLALAEQKSKDMEAENKRLNEENKRLREENKVLKRLVAVASPKETPKIMYGCYYFNDDPAYLYCLRCYETQGNKRPVVNYLVGHKCTVCGDIILN